MSEFYGDTSSVGNIYEENILPHVVFKTRVRIENNGSENPFDWKDMTTEDYFKNKKCILFALPGAFTPICSASHLPEYDKLYDQFRALGVDEIYCLSVNDAFVMRKWGLDLGLEEDTTVGSLGFKKVKLIPDGACLFTRAMGMNCVWESERGFGERSWRYSCYVENGVIKKMFIEQPKIQNSKEDPFKVSDANTMLNYIQEQFAKELIKKTKVQVQ
tara:strand:+ start:571 stop:1218 length:648 start_codon:yes stop_codon:yes gene_type:complete